MKEPDSQPSAYAAFRGTERSARARVAWPALSIAVHLVVLLLLLVYTSGEPPRAASGSSTVVRFFSLSEPEDAGAEQLSMPGPVAIAADPTPIVDLEAPRAIPATIPEPRLPTAESGRSAAGSGAAGETGALGAAVAEGAGPSLERLRYRMPAGGEVWRRSEPPPTTSASAEELMRARVAASIGAYNDSIGEEAAAAARATDWTVTDADGGRWGVSPGKIHLGSVTLPLPFQLATPAGRREEVAGRLANWTAIQQQATIVEGREIVKDRIKAIEQRKAAERAARQNPVTTPPATTGKSSTGGTSGGSTPPPGGGS
jgi:hypothetical protein